MSIAVATLGKFLPATSAQAQVIERVVETGGGTYGYPLWKLKKPQVVIEGPEFIKQDKIKNIEIKLLNLEVENA